MRDVVRDCLKVAAEAATGVVGEVRRRAESGARDLLHLAGVDPEELRERVPDPVLLVVGVVRSEADKAWSRVGDGMVQVGVVLEFLEQQVRQLQGQDGGAGTEETDTAEQSPPSRPEQAFRAPRQRSTAPRPVRVVVDEDEQPGAAAARRRAAVPGMKKAAERKAATHGARDAVADGPAPAKKAPAKKAPAKKVVATEAVATGSVAEKPVAKKSAAKKAAADKSPAAAKTSPAKKAAAKKAPAKKTSAKKTSARKSSAQRPAQASGPTEGQAGDE